jgi:hypothetical protein
VDRKILRLIWIAGVVFVVLLLFVWWLSFYAAVDGAKLATFFAGALALATFFAATAIVAAFAQVRDARKALRDNRAWNRMNAAMSYVPPRGLLHQWEVELEGSFVRLISRSDAISHEDVRALYKEENLKVRLLLRSYLNALESYCIAINSGIADESIGDRIWGYKLVRHFKELKPYIEAVRNRANNQDIFGELEALCTKWSPEYTANKKPSYPIEP